MKLTQIFLRIEKALVRDELLIPSLPTIAIRVRELAAEDNMDMKQLADVARADAGFSVYLMSLANSPIYRGVSAIDDLGQALGRMGVSAVRETAILFAVRSVFQTRDPNLRKLLQALWLRACKVAAYSSVICDELKLYSPEKATTAGLLQQIGLVPLIVELLKDGVSFSEIKQAWSSIRQFGNKVGARMLYLWNMDPDWIAVAKGAEEWTQPHENDLVDTINLAAWHAYLGSRTFRELPPIHELAFFQKHPMLELDEAQSLAFLRAANEKINEIRQALTGRQGFKQGGGLIGR